VTRRFDEMEPWCVEERSIADLRQRGRGQSKGRRRNIGRAIRYWQRRLATGRRSISVPVIGRLTLHKYGRAVELTYDTLRRTYVSADGAEGITL
jgi:hypothetical protein